MDDLIERALMSRIRELERDCDNYNNELSQLRAAIADSSLRKIYKTMFPKAIDFDGARAVDTILYHIERKKGT